MNFLLLPSFIAATMSFSVSSNEQLQAIMNVTAESLAGFCGLGGEDQRGDDHRNVLLKQQVVTCCILD